MQQLREMVANLEASNGHTAPLEQYQQQYLAQAGQSVNYPPPGQYMRTQLQP